MLLRPTWNVSGALSSAVESSLPPQAVSDATARAASEPSMHSLRRDDVIVLGLMRADVRRGGSVMGVPCESLSSDAADADLKNN
jgi:hypothetical protein